MLADAPDTEASAPAACALAASAFAAAPAAASAPTAWPSTNEVQREGKFHIMDLGLEEAPHIPLIIYRCAGKPDHKCPLCVNAFACTCKVVHTWFYYSAFTRGPDWVPAVYTSGGQGNDNTLRVAASCALLDKEEHNDSSLTAAASGAPSASSSGAPSFVRDFSDLGPE